MPNINDISSATYKLLKADSTLAGLCSIYKGAKRPGNAANPCLTANVKLLEPGKGEGIWMCDIVITIYADMLANRTADQETIENILTRVNEILTDTEINLSGAKAFPLIKGESTGSEWQSAHEDETKQETTFGLIFVDFG